MTRELYRRGESGPRIYANEDKKPEHQAGDKSLHSADDAPVPGRSRTKSPAGLIGLGWLAGSC